MAGACASDDPAPVATSERAPSSSPSTASEDPRADVPVSGPPGPVTVRSAYRTLTLGPFTYCYGGTCADGQPPTPLPDIGAADELRVVFPLRDWKFTATFTPSGER